MITESTDVEIKAEVMNRLLRRHCWGAKYLPVDTLINWLGKRIKNNGKRIRKCMEDLAGEGYLLLHKKGNTVSLNPTRSIEIAEYIKTALKI